MDDNEKDYSVTISVSTVIDSLEKLIPILKEENAEKDFDFHGIRWYEEELQRLKLLPPERRFNRSILNEKWFRIVKQSEPVHGKILSLRTFKEDVERFIVHFDSYSKIVSNTGFPRKDNDYGRAAEALENALLLMKML